MIKIGASGAIFQDRFTLDCHVVETRQYPYRVSDCWGVTRKAINNGIYLIFNICWEKDYNPTDEQWRHRVEDVVQKLISLGANTHNCRLSLINEPMKFISKEKYAHLINIAYSQVRNRFLVGTGNEEFLLAQAKGNMYEYILNHSNFDVLDIHIQGSCLKESDCSKWTNMALNWSISHRKILDCTEANYSDVAKESGYKTLLMQLKYAEKIGCIHFPVVFINLSNEDKYRWLSFKYNDKARSPYWEDFKKLMKSKAPIQIILEPIIIEEEDMILITMKRGVKHPAVRWLQQILEEDYDIANDYGKYDGDYGAATERQVKAYQKKIGVEETGIIRATDVIKIYENSSDTALWFKRLNVHASYRNL